MSPGAPSARPGPLAGLRVVDASTLFAAPLVAAMLGDFGADVIKVEAPAGDPLRRIGAQRDGASLPWELVNRNKRGITLDAATPTGRAILGRLLATTDVFVVNQPPAVLARWRCTNDVLAAEHPALVVVLVSCYGADGPYAGRPGAGTLAEAFGGLTHMIGEADGPPMLPSVAVGDILTAAFGVIGAVMACYHRDARAGGGQLVDVSMYEPVMQFLAPTVIAHRPGDRPPARTGSRVHGGAPRNVYRGADGRWIAVSGTTDEQVGRLLPLLGRDQPADVRRFGTSSTRLENADELDSLVATWVGERSAVAAIDALLEARIPAAPVNDIDALRADAHVAARRDIVTVEGARAGPLAMVAPAPRLSETPAVIRATAPALGEHNDEIYTGLLQLSSSAINDLRADGVL